MQSANQMKAIKCIPAWRHGENDLMNFKVGIRMGKKGDLSDFECDMVVGRISFDPSGQKRMFRLVEPDTKTKGPSDGCF